MLFRSGMPVWDFCCDHGYMGLMAYHSGAFPEIHFVDQVPHIIAKLEENFRTKHQREEKPHVVNFWAESGENIPQMLTGTAIIAGVGAHTVIKILRGIYANDRLNAQRLILVPQKKEELLECTLREWNDFQLRYRFVSSTDVVEGHRSRKLLIYDKIL